jgi:short-subunit dehydrogenase
VKVPTRALVTGASSGIGRALSLRLAARGIELWVAARRQAELDTLVQEITAAGGRAHALQLDVSDASGTAARLAALDGESGGIDLVVANAGIGGESAARDLEQTPWSEVQRLFQINLLGAVATLQPFIAPMLSRGQGHLVGVSSIAADVPLPRGAAYGASKAGLSFWLECADIGLRPRGVAVTRVHPGFVKTALTETNAFPMPFLMELDAAVQIIDRGIARRARMIRFPFGTAAAAHAGQALPRVLRDPLIRRVTRSSAP